MDLFSLLFFRLENMTLRIREIYLYIFKFFLTGIPDEDEEDKDIVLGLNSGVKL